MSEKTKQFVYGPVPSRRLGRSLGIDLVPFKVCTYDCVYCQLGRTTLKTVERKDYVPIGPVLEQVKAELAKGCNPDYISLAGSGEPTLNAGIGELISGIKRLTDIPVAVINNGSLLWKEDVQKELMGADLVLPSLDAGDEYQFQNINRPHKDIPFREMVAGIAEFTQRFSGEVWLEVLLCAGVTGTSSGVRSIAERVETIQPARIQLNTAVRPTAESEALAIPMETMAGFKKLFKGKVDVIAHPKSKAKLTNPFQTTKSEDVLTLLYRRPCTTEDVAEGLGIHQHEAIKYLELLVANGKVKSIAKDGLNFFASADRE